MNGFTAFNVTLIASRLSLHRTKIVNAKYFTGDINRLTVAVVSIDLVGKVCDVLLRPLMALIGIAKFSNNIL